MDGHVWWPDSIVNNSLSKVPLLEEITSVFLMSRMDLGEEDHLVHELFLLEDLIHLKIVLLMHSSMASLAGSLEDLESSSEGLGVVCVPGDLRWEVVVTVMHTDRVYLFFVTLNTVWCSDIISEKPSFCWFLSSENWVSSNAGQPRDYGSSKCA